MKDQPLDQKDLRILSVLQENGRISNKELAAEIGLSESASHQRLQRLWKDNWLTGATAQVNLEKLGSPICCLTSISLSQHSTEAFHVLELEAISRDEVLEAYTVSGSADFVMRVMCADMQAYMALTNEMIERCPEIGNISTHVIMKTSKAFKGYPLALFQSI